MFYFQIKMEKIKKNQLKAGNIWSNYIHNCKSYGKKSNYGSHLKL